MSDSPGWSSPGPGPMDPPEPQPQPVGPASWNVPGGTPPGWGSPPPGSGWGPPADWTPATELRPGLIPLRPLALGEILDGAFSVVRRNPKATLGWSAIVIVVSQLISVGVGLVDGSLGSALDATGASSTFGAGPIGGRLLTLVVSAASIGVLTGFVAVVVADAVLGRAPTFGEVWGRVRPRVLPLLVVAVLSGVLPYLALVALVLPGIFLWGALALAPPALVLERLTVGASLRRSWRLATKDWWRVFGIRLIAVLIAGVISAVLLVPAGIVGGISSARSLGSADSRPIAFLIIIAIVATVAGILTQPFVAAVTVLLYIDRRMRAEALDVALASAAGGPASGTLRPGPSGLGPPPPPGGQARAGP